MVIVRFALPGDSEHATDMFDVRHQYRSRCDYNGSSYTTGCVHVQQN